MSANPAPTLTVHVTDKQLSAIAKGIKLNEIREAMPQLEAACNAKIELTESFGDLCKLVALKAGIDAAVLSAYITAVCKDTLNKKQKQVEQLSLLFDELGL